MVAAAAAPAPTENVFDVPVCAPPDVRVAVSVNDPVFETVTPCVASTPAVKLAVVPPPPDNVPLDVISTVPVKLGTVLLLASCATILMLKLEPAVWLPMAPSLVLVTAK